MKYRKLGKTGLHISEISLGTWQLGGKWGEEFNYSTAEKILNDAIDNGINFIDTADVYNDGKSEETIGRVLKTRSEKVYVATKCGRRLNPHTNEAYQPEILKKFVEDSLENMKMDCIDLIQLHCPPTEVYYRPEIFELFDKLISEGKIKNLGVSVEKVEEGLKAIEYPNVSTVQIIFNMFRLRPAELFFKEAHKRDVGILARVPLASGLLTGKFTRDTQFGPDDHRTFNRDGAAFDKGETFSGVDFERGLDAVDELNKLFKSKKNLVHYALKWILGFKEVSCVIPGASSPQQLHSNLDTFKFPHLTEAQMKGVKSIYDHYIRPYVHHRW